ncbi:MAG TPA: hypothetical protein VEI52_13435 [Terriglobales bacterium]|nr:hypothetical protein [Terriglobales bacterium]
MTTPILLGSAALVVIIGLLLFRAIPAIQAYSTYRGRRLVKCPETQQTAAVDVATRKAASTAFWGNSTLQLDQCSRWPERQNCGQECLQQIETDPDNCLVWNIVSRWYEGQGCALCHKHFGRLKHLDHPPALMDADHRTTEWKDFRSEELPGVFATYQPVCWDCHVTETFRREHPELVVYRDRGSQSHV